VNFGALRIRRRHAQQRLVAPAVCRHPWAAQGGPANSSVNISGLARSGAGTPGNGAVGTAPAGRAA